MQHHITFIIIENELNKLPFDAIMRDFKKISDCSIGVRFPCSASTSQKGRTSCFVPELLQDHDLWPIDLRSNFYLDLLLILDHFLETDMIFT